MNNFQPGDKVVKKTEKDLRNYGEVMDIPSVCQKPDRIAVYFRRQVWIKPENLRLLSEVQKKERSQQSEELATEMAGSILAVRGAIIGALAGGHLDGPDASGYAKSVLAQIADLLDIKLPAALKTTNGLH